MAEHAVDYFPLIPGLVLEYQGNAPGEPPSTSRFEILSVTQKWPTSRTVAKCRTTWTSGSDNGSRDFEIVKREDGIFEGREPVLRLPLTIGDSWSEGNLKCEIASFEATTTVPAGEFKHCLRIAYLIAAGDAGSGERFYAPGIGLVREDHGDEASPWSRILTAHNVPYHVFIAHASEDKEEIAKPLAAELRARGLRVWYDEFTLRIGDSLNETINRGLARSWYGVVILSPHFFQKRWPQSELNGMVAMESTGQKVILPVWHHITHQEILGYAPILADRLATNSEKGIGAVAEDIMNAMS